ncbi:phosphate-regulating neutral endopeptidase PHEX-like isoform X2 [Dermacentor albipictus]|uniref:phosphate-regulating neutral endopeptidase PHEX-like isoform X2 n=1 Tax=Dermacentor albipictus TaxID=60249 RepID=UPI0031FDBE0C
MVPNNDAPNEKRSKKRRRSRKHSVSSSGNASSRSSSASSKSEATRRRPSYTGLEKDTKGSAIAALESNLPVATTTALQLDEVIPPRDKSPFKRRLSFAADFQRKSSDPSEPQQQLASADFGPVEPHVATPTAPTTEKPGESIQLPEQKEQQAPQPECETTLPAQSPECAFSGANTIQTLSATSIKERAEGSPKLSEGQPEPQDGRKVSQSSRKASLSHQHASLSSVLQELNTINEEHLEGQRIKSEARRTSYYYLDHAPRSSQIVLTATGVSIKVQHLTLMIVLMLIVTAVTIVIVFLFARGAKSPPSPPFCKTEDCLVHSWRLSNGLNRDLDPCHNFSAYVCSAWSPSKGYLAYSNSAMDDVRKSWFPHFYSVLSEGMKSISVGHKPMAMYESCMGNRSQYGSNLDIFWKFLNECRLSWPEKPTPSDTSALDVLMTLAFKWQVPLFFQVRAMRLSSPNWRFILEPSSLIPILYKQHLTVKSTGGYAKYWATFFYILNRNYTMYGVDTKFINRTMVMEGDVFRKLLNARRLQVIEPALVRITRIGLHTPPLASKLWLRAFRQTELEPEVKPNDQVFIGDVEFFRTMATVMSSYRRTELLSLIAWSCVQLFAPAADIQLLENRYDQGITTYRPYFCERFVEAAYRLLVIALSSVSRFTPAQRAAVKAGFDSLVSAAADAANATQWLDIESRTLAVEKLRLTRLKLWPPERFLENDLLERMYSDFPSTELSFAEYWVKTSRCAAKMHDPHADIDVFSFAVNYALPYVLYDPSSGDVKVAVGAIAPPLYYPGGTDAMFYGGLGFSMALNLVASVDRHGLLWTPNGTFGHFFLSSSSAKAFEERDSCLAALDGHAASGGDNTHSITGASASIFPEIPALEVAYAAYRRAVSDRGDEALQGIVGGFSGDQVFFMTLCYMTCTRPDAVGPHTVDCNKAVRSSEAFARAFHCSPESQMNPKMKCKFFG